MTGSERGDRSLRSSAAVRDARESRSAGLKVLGCRLQRRKHNTSNLRASDIPNPAGLIKPNRRDRSTSDGSRDRPAESFDWERTSQVI